MAQINNQADPQETETALQTWHGFTSLIRYGSVGVVAVLLGLLLFVYL